MALRIQTRELAVALTRAGVRRPGAVLALAAGVLLLLGLRTLGITSEVGYASYFGPDDPRVQQLERFLDEFDSGLHVLVVVACQGTSFCDRATERPVLELLARLQREVERLPNVHRTRSLLNAPVQVAPLETRTLGERGADGRYALATGWEQLAERAADERFLRETVIASDGRSAGIVVELRSLESDATRALVHGLRDLLPAYERELGREIFLAGDPVWTVLLSDSLDADSTRLTALMFLVVSLILWTLFRSLWLTLLPLVAVGALTVATYGVIAWLGIPLTSVLAALPPVLVVVAMTASIHFLTAFRRSDRDGTGDALLGAAAEVGPGCFWAMVTTVGGFASFLLSDLRSTRDFGLVAAIALALSYLVTFALLPALLRVARVLPAGPAATRGVRHDVLGAALHTVTRHPGFVLVASLAVLLGLAAGMARLQYQSDFGIGEQSFIHRSVRFIESNFRKPMTTEVVVSVPLGRRIYDPHSLRLLAEIERWFEGEPSTGRVWSFLDFLEEAYRLDHGEAPASFAQLVAHAAEEMPLVAAHEGVGSFWSERLAGRNGDRQYLDRARVSVDRAWLDDRRQGPYVERLREEVARWNASYREEGYRVELAGALPLTDRFVNMIRDTQWRSFAAALCVVVAALAVLLHRSPRLAVWGVLANVLPATGLLGIMGWAGVGIDPANSMVAAILIAIAVDDSIHVSLRYRRERERLAPAAAMERTFHTVGDSVLTTSVCLALGFSVLMFSSWGGLVAFGLLASLGVVLALVCDLLLLPAALLVAARRP